MHDQVTTLQQEAEAALAQVDDLDGLRGWKRNTWAIRAR